MRIVIDGEDHNGITEAQKWNSGGGFKFYELAPSLLKKDIRGNLVINKEYNPDMLAAAMAKMEGFTYEPSLVLYYRIGNPDQYLKKAEESLDEKKYSAAFDFIQKAEVINDRREDVLFLKAVILNRLKNFDESNLVLDKIELNQRNKKFIEELRKFNENRK